MDKTTKRTPRITKHHFRLRGKGHLYYKGTNMVSFAPIPKQIYVKNRRTVPTFNDDRKFYTSSFQLPSDTPENDELLLENYNRRATESLLEKSELLMPKPSSHICCVCRVLYEDYKEHIEDQRHIGNIRKSEYQTAILQLCSYFQVREYKNYENQGAELTQEGFKMTSEPTEKLSLSQVTSD